jgi:hypothetical protein
MALYPHKYKTYSEIPDAQLKRTKKDRNNTYSQTSRLEKPDEL